MPGEMRVTWEAAKSRVLIEATSRFAGYMWCFRQDTPSGPWVKVIGPVMFSTLRGGDFFYCADTAAPRGTDVRYRVIGRVSPTVAGDEWSTAGALFTAERAFHVPEVPPAQPSDPSRLAAIRTTTTPGLWRENISQAHTLRVEVEVLDAWWNTVATGVPVVSLEWNVDGAALEDVSGSMQVAAVDAAGNSWWPTASNSPLTPFGNRLRVTLTCEGVNGPVSVLLGHALITTVEMARPDGLVTVTFTDIAREYAQSLLESPQPDDGTPITDASGTVTDYYLNTRQFYFGKMLGECRVPSPRWQGWDRAIPYAEMPGARGQWTAGTSRLEVMQRIADVDNLRIWFDRDGKMSFSRSTLDGNTTAATATPALTLSTGEGGTIHSLRTSLSRDGACNRAVVWADRIDQHSTADTVVGGNGVAEAATEPMRWPGSVGDATYVELWGGADSTASLHNAAVHRLSQRRGMVRTMTVETLPMPFVDPGDVVQINTQAASEKFVVRSWRLSLPTNLMTIEAWGWVTGDQATITPLHANQDQITVAAWPLEQHVNQEVVV